MKVDLIHCDAWLSKKTHEKPLLCTEDIRKEPGREGVQKLQRAQALCPWMPLLKSGPEGLSEAAAVM